MYNHNFTILATDSHVVQFKDLTKNKFNVYVQLSYYLDTKSESFLSNVYYLAANDFDPNSRWK